MQEYVCGFLFFNRIAGEPEGFASPRLLMIHKTKPAWQKGLFNGIGGKVEPGEKAIDAMVREFYEEADLTTTKEQWNHYATVMAQPVYSVFFYKTFVDEIQQFTSKTEECVMAFERDMLPKTIVKSNKFLIPLALQNEFLHTVVYESIEQAAKQL
jgi:8-oxo-dGTP diphosphatase